MSPEDSQLLDTRRFSVTEIARIFRVPPHMLGDLERATFSNIEQQSIDFVTYSLMPWLVRWEQEIRRKLFANSEDDYFAEHITRGLLRGDMAARYAAYAIGRQWGWLSADDVRALENENPLPDGQGQIYLVPMNMADAGQVTQANKGVLLDAAQRMLRKEAAAIRKAASQPAAFRASVDSFYAKHEAVFRTAISPALNSIRATRGTAPDPLQITRRHIDAARRLLHQTAARSTAETLSQNVSAALDSWELDRADEIARMATA